MKTKVNPKYRTAYIPRIKVPEEQLKIMRYEMYKLTKQLIQQQEEIDLSKNFNSDEKMKKRLEDIRENLPRDVRGIQDTWNMLREYSNSNSSSLEGKKRQRSNTIETFHKRGFTGLNSRNFDSFVKFMDELRDNGSIMFISSDEVVNYYLNRYEYILHNNKYDYIQEEIEEVAALETKDWIYHDLLGDIDKAYMIPNSESKSQLVNYRLNSIKKPNGKTYRKKVKSKVL